mmetsp:Transcript_31461/g.76076  ORF Transcript_31461/g.76076 Transcript_31461/m.76076 type:complete len:391 (-) Transcript_31461:778-1950(-)
MANAGLAGRCAVVRQIAGGGTSVDEHAIVLVLRCNFRRIAGASSLRMFGAIPQQHVLGGEFPVHQLLLDALPYPLHPHLKILRPARLQQIRLAIGTDNLEAESEVGIALRFAVDLAHGAQEDVAYLDPFHPVAAVWVVGTILFIAAALVSPLQIVDPLLVQYEPPPRPLVHRQAIRTLLVKPSLHDHPRRGLALVQRSNIQLPRQLPEANVAFHLLQRHGMPRQRSLVQVIHLSPPNCVGHRSRVRRPLPHLPDGASETPLFRLPRRLLRIMLLPALRLLILQTGHPGRDAVDHIRAVVKVRTQAIEAREGGLAELEVPSRLDGIQTAQKLEALELGIGLREAYLLEVVTEVRRRLRCSQGGILLVVVLAAADFVAEVFEPPAGLASSLR